MDTDARDVETVLQKLVSETEARVASVAAQSTQTTLSSTLRAATLPSAALRAQSAVSDAPSDHTDGASVDGTEHRELPSVINGTLVNDEQTLQAAQQIRFNQEASIDGQPEPLPEAAVSQSHRSGAQIGFIAPADAPESLTKSSKLLALKQRRLDSLSSSLDLSRESSFDASTQQGREPDHSMQNSLAAALGIKLQPMQPPEADEHVSASTALLPLDSNTGTIPWKLSQRTLNA